MASEQDAAGSPTRALEQLRSGLAKSQQQAALVGGKWAERAATLMRALVRPRLMRQAVAATRRGNLDAAFALLREEVRDRPGVPKSTLLFWGVALSCERAAEAAEPMARLVRDEATAGRASEATDQWLALVTEVPGAVQDVATLARIVPVLRARYSEARGEKAQKQARERLLDALRRSVDPANGALTVAIALRLVEEARGLDADVARRAAEAALASPGLHEAKRARLNELLRSLESGNWPEAPVAAPPVRPAPRPAPPAPAAVAPRPAPRATAPAAPRPLAPAPAPPSKPSAPAPAPVTPIQRPPAPAAVAPRPKPPAVAPRPAPPAFVAPEAPASPASPELPAASLAPAAPAPSEPSPPRVEAQPEAPVASERRPAPPIFAAASSGALRATEITPVELADDGLVAWEVAGTQRTRVHYRAIEAIATAEVAGVGDAGVLVIDLVLRSTRPGRPRSSLRMRSDKFDPASLFPDRTDAGQALRALLSELFDRSGARPLPDPDSALALRPQRFESLAAFEAATLARLSS